MATAYATKAQLQALPGMSALSDALAQIYLDAAAALIDQHCTGRAATSSEYFAANGHAATETYSGRRTRQFRLRRRPVLSVASLSVDGNVWDTALYRLNELGYIETVSTEGIENPRIYRGEKGDLLLWPEGDGNISVTYTAGYAAIPDAVSKACAFLAKQLYQVDERNGVSAESYGPVSKSYTTFSGFSLPVVVTGLLAPYVNMEVGT